MEESTVKILVGLLGTLVGGLITYMGVLHKSKNELEITYTKEIQALIKELKDQNEKKDHEIERLEEVVKELRKQLDEALNLVDKLKEEQQNG